MAQKIVDYKQTKYHSDINSSQFGLSPCNGNQNPSKDCVR